MKEVEINGDNDGESGGSNENTGGFDLDTFKQNMVDIYNKFAETSFTKDNIIMPDAFIINENFSYGEEQLAPHFIDTDLTQFLASCCIGFPNTRAIYLKDSLVDNNSNLYFGIMNRIVTLDTYSSFERVENFDSISDDAYDGNLDLSNYGYLYNSGIS